MTPTDLDPTAAARFLQRYVKGYAAGAFATPSAKDLASGSAGRLAAWVDSGGLAVVAVRKALTRPSRRVDWSGRPFIIPPAVLVTHLARRPGAALPPDVAGAAGWVTAYREDPGLEALLAAQGRGLAATRISAASELLGIWGPTRADAWRELPIDRVALASAPLQVSDATWAAALTEAADVAAWADDFPFYSDGSWSAVSLRGYDPDPAWGVKPAEMGRQWHAKHPGALARPLTWTTLAPATPTLVALARSLAPDEALDRVRLMRMDGATGSTLRRHSDITDKTAGTRPGQMIRLFIPLTTHPTATTTSWDLDGSTVTAHLAPRRVWYLDIRRPHAVSNPSTVARVHLAVDCIATPAVRALLESLAPCQP